MHGCRSLKNSENAWIEKLSFAESSGFRYFLKKGARGVTDMEDVQMNDVHLRINDQIVAFEAKYNMSSEEFRCRYDKGSIGDETDFIEWAAALDMREKIQGHLTIKHKA